MANFTTDSIGHMIESLKQQDKKDHLKKLTSNQILDIVDQELASGKSMNQIQNQFKMYGDILEQNLNNSLLLERVTHLNNDKRGPVINFRATITAGSDVKVPYATTANEKWKFKKTFVVATFTGFDVSTTSSMSLQVKRTIVGQLPMLQRYAIYDLQIQETFSNAHGWNWSILVCKSILPPYGNRGDMKKFFKVFALSEHGDKDEVETIQKSYDSFYKHSKLSTLSLETEINTTLEWIQDQPWKTLIESRIHLINQDEFETNEEKNSKETNFFAKAYPNLNVCFESTLFLANNTWWENLSNDIKSSWNSQYCTMKQSLDMCFRSTMPENLRFLCYRDDEDRSEDVPFLSSTYDQDSDEDYIDTMSDEDEKKELNITKTYKSNKHNELKDLMLELNRWDLLIHLQVKSKSIQTQQLNQVDLEDETTRISYRHGKHVQFIPELSVQQFKTLCKFNKWSSPTLGKKQSDIISTSERQTVMEFSDLPIWIRAVELYGIIRDSLFRTNDCFFDLESPNTIYEVTSLDDSAWKFLIENKVLCWVPGYEKRRILHDHWARCKFGLMKRIHQMETLYETTINSFEPQEEKKSNNTWDEQQLHAVDVSKSNAISIVTGPAGTGKTEVIQLICNTFHNVLVCGFTGKAVDEVASRVSNCTTMTIHSILILPSKQILDYETIVIDELSMVTERLFMQLLAIIGCKRLIFVGDPNQLSPFGSYKGRVLGELIEVPTIHHTRLIHNHRQAKDPSNLILSNATRVLQRQWPLQWSTPRDIKPSFSFVHLTKNDALSNFINKYSANGFKDFQFITGLNKHSNYLNAMCLRSMHHEWANVSEQTLNDSFQNGHRIVFNGRINRQMKDTLDSALNHLCYKSTKQEKRKFRILARRGQQDEIEQIYKVIDSMKVIDYVKRFNVNFKTRRSGNKKQKIDTSQMKLNIPTEFLTPIDFVIRSRSQKVNQSERKLKPAEHQRNDDDYILKMTSGRWFKLSDLFGHSYATTVNKMQGGNAKTCALYLPDHNDPFLNKEFTYRSLYTAITRAKEHFIFLSNSILNMNSIIKMEKQECCSLSCFHA